MLIFCGSLVRRVSLAAIISGVVLAVFNTIVLVLFFVNSAGPSCLSLSVQAFHIPTLLPDVVSLPFFDITGRFYALTVLFMLSFEAPSSERNPVRGRQNLKGIDLLSAIRMSFIGSVEGS